MKKPGNAIYAVLLILTLAFGGVKLATAKNEASHLETQARIWTTTEMYQDPCKNYRPTAKWMYAAFN